MNSRLRTCLLVSLVVTGCLAFAPARAEVQIIRATVNSYLNGGYGGYGYGYQPRYYGGYGHGYGYNGYGNAWNGYRSSYPAFGYNAAYGSYNGYPAYNYGNRGSLLRLLVMPHGYKKR